MTELRAGSACLPAAVAAGFLLMLPPFGAEVCAQEILGAPAQSRGQVRIGPVYITPTLSLGQLGVDTNVHNDAGQPKADFTATLMPSVDLIVPGRRFSLRLRPTMGFVYYHTFKENRSANPGVNLDLAFQVSRFQIYSNNSYRFVQSRPSFEVDARVRHWTADTALGVRYPITPRTSLDVSGRQSRTAFDSDARYLGNQLSETLNQRRREATARITYKLTPVTTVFLDGSWARDRASTRLDRDADTRSLGGGFSFRARRWLSGEARGSYLAFTPKGRDVPDYRGFATDSHVTLQARDTTAVDLAVSRQTQYSYSKTESYFVQSIYQAAVQRVVVRRIDVGARYLYGGSAYVSGASEILRVYGGSLGYRWRATRLSVYTEQWDRKSKLAPGREYSGWRMGVRFAAPGLTVDPRGLFLSSLAL